MLLNRLPRTRIVAGALLIAIVALSGGCGSKNKKAAVTAGADADKYLFDQGQAALKKKSWLKGREYFRTIVENYPQSRFRPEAKLGLGDTYLGENSVESLILGANEYREFLTFFPTHEKAYYAQYQAGADALRSRCSRRSATRRRRKRRFSSTRRSSSGSRTARSSPRGARGCRNAATG